MKIQLGTHPESSDKRDAIHIAVFPVFANQDLEPGQRVRISRCGAVPADAITAIGIVDPFLSGTVYAGSLFWLIVNPGTVKNLRHDWDLPGLEAIEESGSDECRGC